MSPYLAKSLRTEAQVWLTRLRTMKSNFTAAAEGFEEAEQEAQAELYYDYAATIEWALVQLGERQMFDAIVRPMLKAAE